MNRRIRMRVEFEDILERPQRGTQPHAPERSAGPLPFAAPRPPSPYHQYLLNNGRDPAAILPSAPNRGDVEHNLEQIRTALGEASRRSGPVRGCRAPASPHPPTFCGSARTTSASRARCMSTARRSCPWSIGAAPSGHDSPGPHVASALVRTPVRQRQRHMLTVGNRDAGSSRNIA
jgi:hypothetical protein